MKARFHPEAGVTLAELVIVLLLVAVFVGAIVSLSTPWLAREGLRSATQELQSTLQLTRMEAVSRNRPCRLVVDVPNRALQIWDGMGSADRSDDELIQRINLPGSIEFDRPDPGPAVTMTDIGGSRYEAVFDSAGTVTSGFAEVVLAGGDTYSRLQLFVAGGIRIETWTGLAWEI